MTNRDVFDDDVRGRIEALKNHPAFESREALDRFLAQHPLNDADREQMDAVLLGAEGRFSEWLNDGLTSDPMPTGVPSSKDKNHCEYDGSGNLTNAGISRSVPKDSPSGAPCSRVVFISGTVGQGKSLLASWHATRSFRLFHCDENVRVYLGEDYPSGVDSACDMFPDMWTSFVSRARALTSKEEDRGNEFWIQMAPHHGAKSLSRGDESGKPLLLVQCKYLAPPIVRRGCDDRASSSDSTDPRQKVLLNLWTHLGVLLGTILGYALVYRLFEVMFSVSCEAPQSRRVTVAKVKSQMSGILTTEGDGRAPEIATDGEGDVVSPEFLCEVIEERNTFREV